MKKGEAKDVIVIVAIIVGIFLFLWFFVTNDRTTVEIVPDTAGLRVLKNVHTTYTLEDDVETTYYYLLNIKGDTLSWKSQRYNPFVNAKGVVYIPQKGIYDCRKAELYCILPLEDYSDYVTMYAGVSSSELHITVNRNHYLYNLETRELFSK